MPIYEFNVPIQNMTLNKSSFKVGLIIFHKVTKTYQKSLLRKVNVLGVKRRVNQCLAAYEKKGLKSFRRLSYNILKYYVFLVCYMVVLGGFGLASAHMKKLYKIRCKIVHDGVKFIQKRF